MKNSVTVAFKLGPRLTEEAGNPVFTAAVVEQKTLIWRITSPEMRVVANTSVTPPPGPVVTLGPGQPPSQGGSNGDDDDDDDDGDDKDSSVTLQVGPSFLLTTLVVAWVFSW
ncbi:hypothetical protein EGW08_007202 [Elysia chlorotica]|uniref:Uncharacterized protein n=1 Tax=Elysia chlorotica TaxID=188477 RepID=A0A3S0ZRH3_ELYCH|nr:hypothetical protein EGW08_007202 [Elysia chlorotica]